ncbi:MAG TPA: PAS domain S-box protein [Mesorhizobium sp.]
MPSDSYSFLDVAVLDPVRQRFAAGDALVILSIDLEEVIWTNGPGAALFGYPDIEAIIGASAGLPPIARRQIMATGGYPEIGSDRAILVRLASGMTSHAVAFLASAVTMPDGGKAILLALPAIRSGAVGARETAAAIGGFTEGSHFVAFIDGSGNVEAASEGFSRLGITAQTMAGLIADVAAERGRIVKRLVPGGKGSYPAGFARLTDDPARHLLVVIDEGRQGAEPQPRDETGTDAAQAPMATEPQQAAAPVSPEPALGNSGDAQPGPSALNDHWHFSTESETGAPSQSPGHDAPDAAPNADAVSPEAAPGQTGTPAADSPAIEQPAAAPAIDRLAAPVRFVWRTDADGNFSMVSPEFTAVVGQPAANIIGRHFRQVAADFGLDPSGEIAGLLERRDTWSGRSVLWPVAGTSLAVPVDLAALPVYDRNRVFEGFRGFGVARGGDAVADANATGLKLDKITTPPIPESPQEPADADPFKGEVPALAIAPQPERRFADKVIRLAEHRQPANDKGLSTLERSAFREIGERLKKENGPGTAASDAPAATPATPEATPPASPPAQDAAGAEAEAGRQPLEQQAAPPAHDTAAEPDETKHDTGQTERAEGEPPIEASAKKPRSLFDFGEAQPAGIGAPSVFEPARQDDSAATRHEPQATTEEASQPKPASAQQQLATPLKNGGYLPSAFAIGAASAGAPDTSILAKLPVPLLFHAGDTLHYANEEFLDLTGYGSLGELAQAGGLDALFADPYAPENAPDNGDRMLKLKTRDGLEFPIEAILRSVPWGAGKALMLVVRRTGDDEPQEAAATVSHEAGVQAQPDISDLKARIAEMRTIIDTATDGVVLIDRDGMIRSISRPAEALFGFDSDEVAGKPFASLFAIESQRAARDYLAGLSDNGVASVLNDGREVIGRESQGRFIPMFMTIGGLPNGSGFCAVVRDITQWKRAEEDLTQARAVAERASSQKTDFLARISHEIRTPLNAIIGFSELMVDEKFGPVANDRYRDYLRDINRSGNHVLDLVNDLLDISKIEAGQQEMDYEAVSLNDTLAETVAMMQPQANRERVIIRSSFASKLPEVVADLRSVRQIALNILSNAIRYTQAGGQVILSTAYEPSGDVVMRVRDTGIGMSQAEIEQAMKPFKQINALKRGRSDGTGLGLPLTKAMVEANRARFSINSTPGEGTLVEVAFPSTRVLAE